MTSKQPNLHLKGFSLDVTQIKSSTCISTIYFRCMFIVDLYFPSYPLLPFQSDSHQASLISQDFPLTAYISVTI